MILTTEINEQTTLIIKLYYIVAGKSGDLVSGHVYSTFMQQIYTLYTCICIYTSMRYLWPVAHRKLHLRVESRERWPSKSDAEIDYQTPSNERMATGHSLFHAIPCSMYKSESLEIRRCPLWLYAFLKLPIRPYHQFKTKSKNHYGRNIELLISFLDTSQLLHLFFLYIYTLLMVCQNHNHPYIILASS